MMWILTLLLLAPLATAEEAVSFARQIAPLLRDKCLACHSAEKAKGEYRVDNFAEVLKAVAEGTPIESELFKRLTAADEEDRMPQKDEPLSPEQIELFRRWIVAGAKLDQGTPETSLSELIPRTVHANAPDVYTRAQPILALAFDPDGERTAVNGYHEITVWKVSGELQRRISNVPPRVRGLAFHPRLGYLAAVGGKAGRAGELSIYNTTNGAFVTNLVRATDELLAVSFSPDGRLLAAAGADHAIHVFNFATPEKVLTIQQHADWVTALAFSADGARLASTSRDRTARVYEIASENLETTYPAHRAPLYAIGFVNEQLMASGGRDRTIHFWSLEDGKKKHEIGGFGGEIHQLIVAGQDLFTACADRQVRQHSTGDRKLVRTFTGHADAVYALAHHAGGGKLASGSYDGEVRIWSTADGAMISRFIASPGLKVVAN